MESRTQDSRPRPITQKNLSPRTASPRTGPFEAKDRNARGQGQGPRTQAQVFSQRKGLQKLFSGDLQKKKEVQRNLGKYAKDLDVFRPAQDIGAVYFNF